MNFELIPITNNDIKDFKVYMQEAFQRGFEDNYGETDKVILPEKDIDQRIRLSLTEKWLVVRLLS